MTAVGVGALRTGPVADLAGQSSVVTALVVITGDPTVQPAVGGRPPLLTARARVLQIDGRGGRWRVRAPVLVLTLFEREPIEMDGGTTFHFVTDGPAAAMARAQHAAGDRGVSVAGGASTIDQFLSLGLIDELRLHIAPIVLGAGERLFATSGPVELRPAASRSTSLVTHVTYRFETL